MKINLDKKIRTCSLLLLFQILSITVGLAVNNKEESNNAIDLTLLGLLDVTQPPYSADSTGQTDCTAAIQQAIIDARTQKKACFFPSGHYLVSNTLSCEIPVYKIPVGDIVGKAEDACGKYMTGDNKTQHYWQNSTDKIVLIGSNKNGRPVIHLKPGSEGFQSSTNPKPVIKIWAQSRDDRGGTVNPADPCLVAMPTWGEEQPSILFDCAYKGIDIDLGGNPGAIGLRFSGSQGCYLMDAKVNATGAHAGFNNCPGQGGGTYNIEVEGGEYGLKVESTYRFPLLAGCKFTGQTKACVYNTYADLPMVMTGCYFEPSAGSAFDLSIAAKTFGGLSLVDCVAKTNSNIEFAKTKATGENIIIENSYIKGFNKYSTVDAATSINPAMWTLIHEYAYCKTGSNNLINGNLSAATISNTEVATEPDFEVFRSKHWTPIPAFDEPGVVNVKDFGALGNNSANDTQAFKDALAASNKVFVPKGTYVVNETLNLGLNQHLFGNPKLYTGIKCTIATADNVDATSSLSFVDPTAISWKSGKGVYTFCGGSLTFSGNGGGRFYGLSRMKTLGGNLAPMSIYSYNVERVTTNPMSEIKNAKNINIYYFKVEAGTVNSGTGNDKNTPVQITNSDNVRIYGIAGVAKTIEDRPMINVVNSTNVSVSLVKSLDTSVTSAPAINEVINGATITYPRNTGLCLFLRNQTTAVAEVADIRTKIFPNPIVNQLSLETQGDYDKLEIYSNLGVKLYEKEIQIKTIQTIDNLENIPSGIHFLKLIGKNQKQLIRIMKL